ncbi:uncharacterized protein LOC113470667 [Diaphorina citri]|uniref:Uncharacterized protein LOC113470667 n=1 Tax=Diaphorina citri TaxID=121845 RepID=A0A3Q0JDR5_DIACI|nr:uncharacterized protein LOC113470667 [Diaphorina citri]
MCLESKEEAFAEYRTVVKQLETFEQVTYHDWLHKVFPIIETNLNSSIFKIVPLKSLKDGKGHIVRPLLGDREMVEDVIMDEEEKEEYEEPGIQEGVRGSIEDTYIPIKFLTRLKRKHAARLRGPAREEVKVTEAALAAAGLAERRLTFQVNFDYAAMFDITYEGEAFKRMGFDLPESVKDLLDKKLELRVNLPQLESIVDKYRTLMMNLDPDMYLILKRQVFKLETCILPGTSKSDSILETDSHRSENKTAQDPTLSGHHNNQVFPIIETNLNSSIFKIVPLKSLKDGKDHIARPLLGDRENLVLTAGVFPIIETNLNSSIFKIVPLKSLKDGKDHIARPLLGDREMVEDVNMDEEEKEEYEEQGVQGGIVTPNCGSTTSSKCASNSRRNQTSPCTNSKKR